MAAGQAERTDAEAGLERVGLVAGEGPRETIVEFLLAEGFAPVCFDSIEALLDIDVHGEPVAIVLCIEEAISSAAALIEPLRRRFERSPVVVACPSVQRWEVRSALAAGALGVVVYGDMAASLGPCLRAARAGQVCVPGGHWRQIERPVLSAREKQVLGLVVMGYMNGQIAERLFLAESTVKSHLSSAFGKLGVRSRNEAVDLILDPERGLGMGILGLVGESLQSAPPAVR